MNMRVALGDDEIAYLFGEAGTVALARSLGAFFYLETEKEEIVIFTEPDDLIVASTFSPDDKAKKGLKCTIFQIRELCAPLIVLKKGHPASKRLNTVVSIGSRTRLSCNIQPGTHPEQDVLCGGGEFDGVEILACPGGADVKNFSGKVATEKI